MFGRSGITIGWQNLNDLAIGAAFFVDVGAWDSQFASAGGGIPAGGFCAPVKDLRHFALDVRTDDVVEVDIQTGATTAGMTTMVTLVTVAGLTAHFTTYNLPPPFNRDGFLILASNFVRLQVRNTSGNVVSPFELSAFAWA